MKLNLILDNPNAVLSGYTNIDPFADENDKKRIKNDVSNLDNIVDDSECEEIRAVEVIEYYQRPDMDRMLSHWIKKLKRGGILTVIDVDLYNACRLYAAQAIDTKIINELLHGMQEKNWDYRKVNISLEDVQKYLESKSMSILSSKIVGLKFVIKAEKN